MKFNLDTPIKNLAGEHIGSGAEAITLKTVCVRSLTTLLDEDKNITVERAEKRYALAMNLQAGGEIDLTAEQITELRNRIAKVFMLEVAGAALGLLKV